MNYKKIFKRETKVIAYVVICLTLAVLGSSYALFLQVNNNSNNQVVEAGSLVITYGNGSTVSDFDEEPKNCLTPKDDGEGKTKGCLFTLSVTNEGTLPMEYNLLIYNTTDAKRATEKEKESTKDMTLVDFKYINYHLEKEITKEKSSPTVVADVKKLSDAEKYTGIAPNGVTGDVKKLETSTIDAGQSITFNLRIWIDEETALTSLSKNEGGTAENSTNSIIGKAVDLTLDVKGVVYEKEQTLASIANVEGKYVTYKPFLETFSVGQEDTGVENAQTITPSELTKWQVLNKNGDGTLDLISVNVSSTNIKFKGQTGYKNYVGTLNKLAGAYEDKAYTVKSRIPGYVSQTEIITTELQSTTCGNSTGVSGWNDIESSGCGDTNYQTDETKMNTILSGLVGKTVENSEAKNYWLASRYFGNSPVSFSGRYIDISGTHKQNSLYNGSSDQEAEAALRPIVTLKAGVEVASGSGTADDPYVLADVIAEKE